MPKWPQWDSRKKSHIQDGNGSFGASKRKINGFNRLNSKFFHPDLIIIPGSIPLDEYETSDTSPGIISVNPGWYHETMVYMGKLNHLKFDHLLCTWFVSIQTGMFHQLNTLAQKMTSTHLCGIYWHNMVNLKCQYGRSGTAERWVIFRTETVFMVLSNVI